MEISAIALDVAVVSVLLLSAVIAYMRGFIKEVLTIAGLIGASVASYALSPSLRPWFHEILGAATDGKKEAKRLFWNTIPADVLGDVLSYGTVFIAVFISLTIISFFISKVAQEMGLSFMDRSLGVVFGLARGVALLVLLYLPFSFMMKADEFPPWTKESRTLPVLAYSANAVCDYLEIEDESCGKGDRKMTGRFADRFKNLFTGAKKSEEKQMDKLFPGYDDASRGELEKLIDGTSREDK